MKAIEYFSRDHIAMSNTRGMGELSKVMQTLDGVWGLRNSLRLSEPPST